MSASDFLILVAMICFSHDMTPGTRMVYGFISLFAGMAINIWRQLA